jgi:hypothetical protein
LIKSDITLFYKTIKLNYSKDSKWEWGCPPFPILSTVIPNCLAWRPLASYL